MESAEIYLKFTKDFCFSVYETAIKNYEIAKRSAPRIFPFLIDAAESFEKHLYSTRELCFSVYQSAVENYEISRSTTKKIAPFLLDATKNPSVKNFNDQLVLIQKLIETERSFNALIFTCAISLVICIVIYLAFRCLFVRSAPDKSLARKNISDEFSSQTLPPQLSPGQETQVARQLLRESSRALMETFASKQAERIAALDLPPPSSPSEPPQNPPPKPPIPSPRTSGGRVQTPSSIPDSRDSNDFDTWSVQSGVTSEYMEADRHYCDDRDSFCASPATASSSVLDRSLLDPGALSGLRVAVAGHGVGIVLGFERKKFRSTRFRVLFDDGKVKLLKLKRSAKKGVVPFTLLEAQQSGAQDNENGENFAEESVKSFRG